MENNREKQKLGYSKPILFFKVTHFVKSEAAISSRQTEDNLSGEVTKSKTESVCMWTGRKLLAFILIFICHGRAWKLLLWSEAGGILR